MLRRFCQPECVIDRDGVILTGGDIPKYSDIGECTLGETQCNDNMIPVGCLNYIGPTVEVCDNLDNDCDGVEDDGLYSFAHGSYTSEDYPCLIHGECVGSHTMCEDGIWKCYYNGAVEYAEFNVGGRWGTPVLKETRCDGFDNDCDGRVDEDLFQECVQWDGSAGLCTCYSGPIGSNQGSCHGGFVQCVNGESECIGESLPQPERCNDLDDDCDGIIDNTEDTLDVIQLDIVFNIDTSGSMCGDILAVATANDAYVSQFENNPNYRFAVVIMTAYANDPTTGRVAVLEDFTNIITVRNRLLSLGCNGWGTEESLGSMYFIADKGLNPLALSWRQDAVPLVFTFSDEPDQSFLSPSIDRQDVIDMSNLYGVTQYTWTNHPNSFGPIATATGGANFNLSSDWVDIFNDENSIYIIQCVEG